MNTENSQSPHSVGLEHQQVCTLQKEIGRFQSRETGMSMEKRAKGTFAGPPKCLAYCPSPFSEFMHRNFPISCLAHHS